MQKKSFIFAAILGLLTAIGPLCTDFYLPALPEIAAQFDTTATLTQLSLTSALAGLGVGQLIFGPISDRTGRKAPLIFSLMLFVAASVLCAITHDIYALIGWRFLQGLAGAGGSVLARSIARDNYQGTVLTQFFALLMTVNGIAPVFSPVLGGYLSSRFDWRMLFWVMAATGIVLAIVSLVFVRESLQKPQKHTLLLNTAKSVIRNRQFIRYCLTQAFMMAGLFSYIGSSSFVFQTEYGLSPLSFSLIFGINGLGLVFAALIFSWLARRYRAEALLRTGLTLAVIAAMSTLALAWLNATLPVLIALFFTIAFNSGISTLAGAEAMNAVEAGESGTASAVLGMLMFLFGGLATPLAGIGGESMIKMTLAVLVSYVIALALTRAANAGASASR